jgi:uncharacterized protein
MDTLEENSLPENKRPEIVYPCLWHYKVIGKDPELIKAAIRTACAPFPVRISRSRSSSGGTYLSFNAELEVTDEAMRLSIYHLLTTHPAVKLVL